MSAVEVTTRRPGLDGLSRVAAGFLAVVVAVGVTGRLAGFTGSGRSTVGPRLSGPGASWPLGTDALGRSLLPRIVEGIGTTLLLSALAVLLTGLIALTLGLAAAYSGRFLDGAVRQVVNLLFAFPPILLALLVCAIVGPGVPAVLAAIVAVTAPGMIRVVRAGAASVSVREFVLTSRIGGAPMRWVLTRHVLPNVLGPVTVQLSYALSLAIVVESSLSFLGFGVQPPAASLGALLQEGSVYLTVDPWYALGPGVVLALSILAVNLVGDGLRDRLDPRTGRSLT